MTFKLNIAKYTSLKANYVVVKGNICFFTLSNSVQCLISFIILCLYIIKNGYINLCIEINQTRIHLKYNLRVISK